MSGRKLTWSWKYFTKCDEQIKGKNAVVGYCRFCNPNCEPTKPGRYVDNAGRQEKQLEKCNKVGPEARKEMNRILKEPTARQSRSQSPESKKPKPLQSVDPSSQSSSGTIKCFFDSTSKDDQEELDILLTRAFATGNIAPNFLDNPFFKQFVTKLKPSYKLPSRNDKHPKLIKAEFDRVQKSLKESCDKANFLAVSSDGWTDVQGNNIINFIVHTPKPFLLDSIDATAIDLDGNVERIQHSGKFISELITERIVKLGKNKIVAVVTDHAANMRNAWKKLSSEDNECDPQKKYTGETVEWILFEGCKAHAVDLAAKDICGKTQIADCLKYCVEIAKFFRKKTPELILSKAQGEQGGSSNIMQLPVKTRWGTYSKLFSSIASNENALKSAICAPGILNDGTLKKEAERLRKILRDSEDFWLDVKDASNILSPLADAVKVIEGDEVNSRRAYKKIHEAFTKSKAAVETSDFLDEIKLDLLEAMSEVKKPFNSRAHRRRFSREGRSLHPSERIPF